MYAVKFNVPDWKEGWLYSQRTIKRTKEEAKELLKKLNKDNPHISYKVEEIEQSQLRDDPHNAEHADEVVDNEDGSHTIQRVGKTPVTVDVEEYKE